MTSKQHEQNTRQRLYEVGCAEWQQSTRSPNAQRRFAFKQISFFAGGTEYPTITARQLATRFAQSSTRFVYFQVEMVNPWRSVRWTYRLVARLYHPDGALMEEVHDRVMVEPACETFCYTGRLGAEGGTEGGAEASGQWSPGGYRVEICVDDQATIGGNFTIAADKSAQRYNIKRLLRLTGLQPG